MNRYETEASPANREPRWLPSYHFEAANRRESACDQIFSRPPGVQKAKAEDVRLIGAAMTSCAIYMLVQRWSVAVGAVVVWFVLILAVCCPSARVISSRSHDYLRSPI